MFRITDLVTRRRHGKYLPCFFLFLNLVCFILSYAIEADGKDRNKCQDLSLPNKEKLMVKKNKLVGQKWLKNQKCTVVGKSFNKKAYLKPLMIIVHSMN